MAQHLEKASVARDLGAAGIIFVHDNNSTEQEVVPFESSTREKISIQAISLIIKLEIKFERAGKDFTKTSNSFETGEQRRDLYLRKFLDSSISNNSPQRHMPKHCRFSRLK